MNASRSPPRAILSARRVHRRQQALPGCSGATSALTPRHTFNTWLKHGFGNGYYAAAGGRAKSARYASPDDLTAPPGHGVIHLGAGYTSRNFDLALTLENLPGRRYFVAAHSGRQQGGSGGRNGAPRHWRCRRKFARSAVEAGLPQSEVPGQVWPQQCLLLLESPEAQSQRIEPSFSHLTYIKAVNWVNPIE